MGLEEKEMDGKLSVTFNIVTGLSSQPKSQFSHNYKRYILWVSNYKTMAQNRQDRVSGGRE